MSKQRPDPDKMTNELSGASAFFRKRTPVEEPTPPPAATAPTIETPPVSASTTPEEPPTSARHDVTTERRHDVMPLPSSTRFDLNQPTTSHDTLRLSSDETRAMEDLKSALKWEHDVTVSKNDICRAAIHELIEEYRAKGSSSAAVKRLKKKLGRQ